MRNDRGRRKREWRAEEVVVWFVVVYSGEKVSWRFEIEDLPRKPIERSGRWSRRHDRVS
jgi:hypothetical protein